MDLVQRFKDYIHREDLFRQSDRLLLAVSGGVDSVVLCDLCHACGFTFQIAHCNFNLRGAESDGDAALSKATALRYSVEYYQKDFETIAYAEKNKLSVQVAARELRYAWFSQLLESNQEVLTYLLTAHHADDNVETILMNFFKGTGINGLKGILPKHRKIIRPLLFAKKEDLIQYATDNKLDYREDSSNASDKYARNFFRNNLIPSIEKVFPAVTENLAANAERFRDIRILYQQAIQAHLKKLIVLKAGETHIPVLKLKLLPAASTLLFEILKDYGFTSQQSAEAVNLLDSETGKFVNSSTHRVFKYDKWLIISELQNQHVSNFIIHENENYVSADDFALKLIFRTTPVELKSEKNIALLDKKLINYPLILRKWKQGDYFYPLGMRKKKKIGRFLSDEKLTLTEKENTWVLESDKRIIWVVGRRIDDRFKLTDKTTELLEIDRLPAE